MSVQRIDKIITSQGLLTRTDVRRMVKSGAVQVNGAVVKDPGKHVDTQSDQITINGIPLIYREHIYIMMNKPAGVLSASRDPKTPTVIDLVPKELQRAGLFPAGRLDKDTTGFILITDDGDFAHRILSPKNHVPKVYEAELDAPVHPEDITAFSRGIVLEDGVQCRSAVLEPLADKQVPAARVTLCEGKFHQVKRMFAAVGKTVVSLKRLSIGGVALDESLAPSQCRLITDLELHSILNK